MRQGASGWGCAQRYGSARSNDSRPSKLGRGTHNPEFLRWIIRAGHPPGCPIQAPLGWGSPLVPSVSCSRSQRNNGPGTLVPRPLPVICWDWTKAIALPRVPEPRRRTLRQVLPGSGARCPRPQSPHVRTTRTVIFHRLDHPPFPCKPKLNQRAFRVKLHRFVKRRLRQPGLSRPL